MKVQDGTASPPFPHIDGKGYSFPTFVEVKVDGEANIFYKGQLVSKASGKIRWGCPITETLSKIVDGDTIVFGELHWEDGKKGALYKFLSHAKDDGLNFTIFDVHHPTLVNASYMDRREWMISNILSHPAFQAQALYAQGSVRITRSVWIEDQAMLDTYIQDNRRDGWEGLVIKHPNSILFQDSYGLVGQNSWVKVKHRETGDYEISSIDPQLERMEVRVPMNGFILNGKQTMTWRIVGVKLVNKYKPLVKVGDIVEIEHMGVLSGGGLRHPNFLGKIKKGNHAT